MEAGEEGAREERGRGGREAESREGGEAPIESRRGAAGRRERG
jgi:hypothetical protein